MKRFATWLWKEWRDQRAVTIGILIAIPALTALAYWAFGEKLGGASLGKVRTIFLGIGVGLVVFAIAGDLLAGENRRKTIHALRRLPGGMRSAFLAKLTFLALLLVVVVALQGVSLAVAENLNAPRMARMGISAYHSHHAVRSVALFEQLAQFPGGPLWLTGLGFGVLALWTLLVSSWLGRSGVAGIGAIALLAALATPFFLFFREHPWFFPGPLRLASMTAAAAALVALVAVSLSFLRGQRYAGRAFRPFLLGSSVLLVSLGGSYAYAHKSLAAWLDIKPSDEDFRIDEAHYAAGGKYLYLNVHRGRRWSQGRPYDERWAGRSDWSSRRGSPEQVWVVDLETGAYRIVDDRAERWIGRVPESLQAWRPQPLDPAEALVCRAAGQEESVGLAWWDARAGSMARVLPYDVRDRTTLQLAQRQLRADAWLRDADGRRVWMRDGIIEHEGEERTPPTALVPRHPQGQMVPIPGGWYGARRMPDGSRSAWSVVDAHTGEEQRLAFSRRYATPMSWHILSPDFGFGGGGQWVIENGKRVFHPQERLLRLEDPEHPFEVKNAPQLESSVVGLNLALALRGQEEHYRLHVWNPVTGADYELAWNGAPLDGIKACLATGRTGDGRILLQLDSHGPTYRAAWVVLDASLKTLTPLGGWGPVAAVGLRVTALLADDSLVILQGRRRVIRLYPDGTSEVLFPRK